MVGQQSCYTVIEKELIAKDLDTKRTATKQTKPLQTKRTGKRLVSSQLVFFWAHAVRARGSDGHSIVCGKRRRSSVGPRRKPCEKVRCKETNKNNKNQTSTQHKANQTKQRNCIQVKGEKWSRWPSALSRTPHRNKTTHLLPSKFKSFQSKSQHLYAKDRACHVDLLHSSGLVALLQDQEAWASWNASLLQCHEACMVLPMYITHITM